MTEVVELRAADFVGARLQKAGTWAVDFFTPWCAPCKALQQVFAELSDTSDSSVHFAALDISTCPGPAEVFDVASVPTIVIFVDGVEQRRLFGAKSARQLTSAIDRVAGGSPPE
ncbi:MAG TPA: thioredoxin family protein [Jatrophihabitantaceae bacterium]|jgi:thioredoxin 1|nr:thioredoxin family protein [Jatrophihabitantaceae bacterium]